MFDNFPTGEIEHFTQGVIVGKAGLILGDLTELAVETLDDICRVYDFPNLLWICKEGAQNIPVFLPAFDTGRILPAPLFSELHQVFQGFVLCNRGINLFQDGYGSARDNPLLPPALIYLRSAFQSPKSLRSS